jgi:hypothetical protein
MPTRERLHEAAEHISHAMGAITDAIQAGAPVRHAFGIDRKIEELQLLVRALADIHDSLLRGSPALRRVPVRGEDEEADVRP